MPPPPSIICALVSSGTVKLASYAKLLSEHQSCTLKRCWGSAPQHESNLLTEHLLAFYGALRLLPVMRQMSARLPWPFQSLYPSPTYAWELGQLDRDNNFEENLGSGIEQ